MGGAHNSYHDKGLLLKETHSSLTFRVRPIIWLLTLQILGFQSNPNKYDSFVIILFPRGVSSEQETFWWMCGFERERKSVAAIHNEFVRVLSDKPKVHDLVWWIMEFIY